jgi:hypothetical protein
LAERRAVEVAIKELAQLQSVQKRAIKVGAAGHTFAPSAHVFGRRRCARTLRTARRSRQLTRRRYRSSRRSASSRLRRPPSARPRTGSRARASTRSSPPRACSRRTARSRCFVPRRFALVRGWWCWILTIVGTGSRRSRAREQDLEAHRQRPNDWALNFSNFQFLVVSSGVAHKAPMWSHLPRSSTLHS